MPWRQLGGNRAITRAGYSRWHAQTQHRNVPDVASRSKRFFHAVRRDCTVTSCFQYSCVAQIFLKYFAAIADSKFCRFSLWFCRFSTCGTTHRRLPNRYNRKSSRRETGERPTEGGKGSKEGGQPWSEGSPSDHTIPRRRPPTARGANEQKEMKKTKGGSERFRGSRPRTAAINGARPSFVPFVSFCSKRHRVPLEAPTFCFLCFLLFLCRFRLVTPLVAREHGIRRRLWRTAHRARPLKTPVSER